MGFLGSMAVVSDIAGKELELCWCACSHDLLERVLRVSYTARFFPPRLARAEEVAIRVERRPSCRSVGGERDSCRH